MTGAAIRRLVYALLWAPILVAALGSAAAVEPMVPVPPLQSLVTDPTGTLTAEQKSGLEQRLRAFESKKGSQVAVLIVASTQPEAIEQYALRVAEQWKLGRKKIDDGALLLVAKNDRALRIEVGYGLEGVLNDATAKRVISEIITPKFKLGDYFGGINDGVNSMLGVIEGEPLPAARPRASEQFDLGRVAPVLMIIAITAGGVLRSLLGRFPGAVVTAGAVGFVAWLLSGALMIAALGALIALVFTLFGGRTGGLGGRYGRGGGGGFGGGGFGGGGGGGFGGGGASGRW